MRKSRFADTTFQGVHARCFIRCLTLDSFQTLVSCFDSDVSQCNRAVSFDKDGRGFRGGSLCKP